MTWSLPPRVVQRLRAASTDSAVPMVVVNAASVVISARIEEEISQLDADEAAMFLTEMGLEEAGLDRLIKAAMFVLQFGNALLEEFGVGHIRKRQSRQPTAQQG